MSYNTLLVPSLFLGTVIPSPILKMCSFLLRFPNLLFVTIFCLDLYALTNGSLITLDAFFLLVTVHPLDSTVFSDDSL